MQENGTDFWVLFDNFNMTQRLFDDTCYHYFIAGDFNCQSLRTNVLYPIHSVGNVTTSLNHTGTVILIRPDYTDYIGSLEDRQGDRYSDYRNTKRYINTFN